VRGNDLKIGNILGIDFSMTGRIETGYAYALIETELGGERILQELEEDPLPRIC